MTRTYATLLALLAIFTALFYSPEGTQSAAVPQSAGRQRGDPSGPLKMIFMKESEASDFFRRRSRRGLKSQDEINAEQRQILAADERKREFHQGKRNEFESHAEEEQDGRPAPTDFSRGHSEHQNTRTVPEQDERSRESTEQWREFHYDGMYPPQEYNRHRI